MMNEKVKIEKPAIVFSQKHSGKRTIVLVGNELFGQEYCVKNFDIENGVLTFETEDGRKICTNRPFFLKEESIGEA